MSDLPTGKPIHGGRAYSLARLSGASILYVWTTLLVMVFVDKYTPELNNLALATIAALGTLGGAAQIPNVAERWGGKPDPNPNP